MYIQIWELNIFFWNKTAVLWFIFLQVKLRIIKYYKLIAYWILCNIHCILLTTCKNSKIVCSLYQWMFQTVSINCFTWTLTEVASSYIRNVLFWLLIQCCSLRFLLSFSCVQPFRLWVKVGLWLTLLQESFMFYFLKHKLCTVIFSGVNFETIVCSKK